MLASETRMVGPSRRCRFRATRFPSRFGELGGAVAVLAVLIVYALSGWALENRPPASTSTEALQTHARFLASRDLEGRSVDSAGIQKARDYIAREFARYGLEPAGDNGTYLQSFETVVGVSHREPTRLTAGGQALQLGVEWIPLGLSASDKTEAELVFAGYGITAKEHGYDDYAGLDVRNKIVIVLRYEPPPKTESSPFRKAPRFSAHAGLRTKANNAREHGAAGMILVDAHADDERGELVPIGSSLWRSENRIVAAQVKRSVVDRWLAPYGVSVAALRERIDRFEKPGSMPLPGASISLTVTLEAVRRRTANVIAVAPGYDAKHSGEAIVIGAHYDHIGRGQFGARDSSSTGQIHYGADDNASGVAVLLELARRLGAVKLPRAVVLAAFSAEELGLFGSRHYVNRPAFPLDKTRAMINLDMVGRLRGNRVTVFGTGSARTFPAIVLDAARPLGLEVRQSDGIGRSDHMSFYARRIPVLHFFTGLHEDYHRPTDTWEKLNLDGMAKITDLVFAVAERIAATRDPLEFVSVPGAASGIDVGGFNVYLGTIPDYESSLPGVRLAGVAGGSPAALAGLREGDVIVGFAGSEVRTIDDLTVQLQGRMPGEEVEIAVLRQSQPVSVKAVLSTRP